MDKKVTIKGVGMVIVEKLALLKGDIIMGFIIVVMIKLEKLLIRIKIY